MIVLGNRVEQSLYGFFLVCLKVVIRNDWDNEREGRRME